MSAIAADSVVSEALANGTLGLEALRTAWQYRKRSGDPSALWRILADVEGADARALFQTAAGHAGYQKVDVSPRRTARFLGSPESSISSTSLPFMAEVGVFPAVMKCDPVRVRRRVILIAFEPQSPEVQSCVEELGAAGGALAFASPQTIAATIRASLKRPTPEELWWFRRYVLGERPIRLYMSSEFSDSRKAA